MDKAQFEALAGRYRDMVYRIALNRLRNPADAEDAVQDVLLKLEPMHKPVAQSLEKGCAHRRAVP